MDALSRVEPSRQAVWWRAFRPKTLSLALAPVLMGTAWVLATGSPFRVEVLLLAALAAVAIQVGTNLWNDALDAEHGVDDGARLGPRRATAAGWLSGRSVRRAALGSFALAAALGAVLVAIGGWPILLLGTAAIALGLAYSAGPLPLSATPLGEALVLAFFGVFAVVGTVWLHAATAPSEVWLLGLFTGLPAAAVLLVNNHRDRLSDSRSGRKTLAIRLGVGHTRRLYAGLLGLAGLAPLALRPDCAAAWLGTGALVLTASWLASAFAATPVDRRLNRFLMQTGRFQLLYVAVMALVLWLCG